VEEVANSKHLVRDTWRKIKSVAESAIPSALRELMDRELEREAVLLVTVGGDIISKLIESFLINHFPDSQLKSNGRSDYPDLFLRSKNYDGLPLFTRRRAAATEYGAAIKSDSRRPVRVPDGLEIKTCKDRFAVDCHHAHAGLHLVLLFRVDNGSLIVADIMVAFLQYSDYRITVPASAATTLKASFNDRKFISLLSP